MFMVCRQVVTKLNSSMIQCVKFGLYYLGVNNGSPLVQCYFKSEQIKDVERSLLLDIGNPY